MNIANHDTRRIQDCFPGKKRHHTNLIYYAGRRAKEKQIPRRDEIDNDPYDECRVYHKRFVYKIKKLNRIQNKKI